MAFPSQPRQSRTKPVFIGFAGHMGAGKTSAAMYLSSKYAFQYARYSQILREWFPAEASDGERLQKLGWRIMDGGLQMELNARLVAGLDRSRSAAIDGLRHPIDVQSLSTTFGDSFFMIFLEAPSKLRFDRLRKRFSSYAAFQAAESQPVEAHIDSLKPLASITISHDGSLELLHGRLDDWIGTCAFGDR